MFALRERRIHVRQEDLEMAVAKVSRATSTPRLSLSLSRSLARSLTHTHGITGDEEGCIAG